VLGYDSITPALSAGVWLASSLANFLEEISIGTKNMGRSVLRKADLQSALARIRIQPIARHYMCWTVKIQRNSESKGTIWSAFQTLPLSKSFTLYEVSRSLWPRSLKHLPYPTLNKKKSKIRGLSRLANYTGTLEYYLLEVSRSRWPSSLERLLYSMSRILRKSFIMHAFLCFYILNTM
jgi:hypothetical protein